VRSTAGARTPAARDGRLARPDLTFQLGLCSSEQVEVAIVASKSDALVLPEPSPGPVPCGMGVLLYGCDLLEPSAGVRGSV
jgi:hypothetical protein